LGGFWAMRRMLRDLPLGFPLWLLLHLPGMNWLGPKVYRLIARNRYAINRFFGVELEECDNDVCKIPS
jgi:predicted DCC family thiol-disulfide oxidoreductase YuxK